MQATGPLEKREAAAAELEARKNVAPPKKLTRGESTTIKRLEGMGLFVPRGGQPNAENLSLYHKKLRGALKKNAELESKLEQHEHADAQLFNFGVPPLVAQTAEFTFHGEVPASHLHVRGTG